LTIPVIVTATFGDGDNGWLQALRRTHYPPERNQVPAHLTLLRQLPPSLEAELATRLARAAAAPPPRALVAGIMDLGEGTALRIESADLEAIRAELADAFHGALTAQDRSWSPHITIQNKVTPRVARALQRQLRATFEPRPLAIRALAAWRYLGGPWEPIRSWAFRL
jgi:2'-5' RNA ligase